MSEYQRILKGDDVLEIPTVLPLLPVRELVVFPYSVVPLLVGRTKSLKAIQVARDNDDLLLVATQKNAEQEALRSSDIFRVGTVCRILQLLEFPNGHAKVVVEGVIRAKIRKFNGNRQYFRTEVDIFEEMSDLDEITGNYVDQLHHYFKEYIALTPDLPEEMLDHLQRQGDTYRMIDFVALNIQASAHQKQQILEERDIEKRLIMLLDLIRQVIGHHQVRMDLDQKVQENLMKNQRNYYIQEKLKIINKELGEDDDLNSPELMKLEDDIFSADMPDPVLDKATEEFNKLRKIPPFSPEYTVIRNYLDWMIRLPWQTRTQDRLNIAEAQKILDEDHYGLEKPKERIIEHLAVMKRVKQLKGPILCLVGPPGVGKTSLGKSIARALGRNFTRISLGGVRDEAEIRGHRRTYIGSMPGKFIQSMKKVGSVNPVILLDEVDKLSSDFRGDPASALLEVLDPEQNRTFNDHYLDVDYDLSDVFFLTTANVRSNIPLPLQDRMEIIELPGYLEHEKLSIARYHLIPKQMQAHGLVESEMRIEDDAVLRVIREYTREAGVRELERQLANLCRKTVRLFSEAKNGQPKQITQENLDEFLGKPLYLSRESELEEQVGVATGLAWTSFGGDILKIEVIMLPGKGKLTLTGKLGDVMKESANIALSYVRAISGRYNIDREIFENNDLHLHLPEGAVPKDGPSAGAALAAAMLSAIIRRPLRNNIALTGELTLRGKILAVGGINEKLLAAQRNNIRTVLLPKENRKEVHDLPKEIRDGMTIIEVQTFEDVLEKILV
ncbi:MAG: endopeptidase La [Calditrichia bacterium]